MNRPRRLLAIAVFATAAATGGPGVAALAATPATPDATIASAGCRIQWGSLPETSRVHTYTTSTIRNLRAGAHRCFDRLVVDLGRARPGVPGGAFGYQVRYAPDSRLGASGDPLPIRGGAVISVVVNAAAHDLDYQPTYEPLDPMHAIRVAGFRTFRQVAFLGTFEAQTDIAIGVRARLPFRAFVLAGPDGGARLVIDVAHRW